MNSDMLTSLLDFIDKIICVSKFLSQDLTFHWIDWF